MSEQDEGPRPLGWHVLSGEDLMDAMRRTAAGEDPDQVYIELWVNAEHEQVPGDGSTG